MERGLFAQIFEKRDLKVSDPKAWNPSLWNLYGSQSYAGVTVNEVTALNTSAVFACIRKLANTVASLPLHLYRRRTDDGKEKANDRNLYYLWHTSPNSKITSFRLRQTAQGHLGAWGNSYSYVSRDRQGRIREIWPLRPDRMRLDSTDSGQIVYVYRSNDGTEIPLTSYEVFHVPGFGFDGIQGYSIVNLARQGIGLTVALEEFGARYFGSGTHPGAVVKHPGKLSPGGHDNLAKDLRDKYSSLGKAHKLLLLEEGMDFEAIGIPPEDAQFLQSRKFQINDIARWFDMQPHKIGDLEHATYTNIEEQNIEFAVDTIRPWLVLWEQELSRYFLPQEERKTYLFEFVMDGLLRGNAQSRWESYRSGLNTGVLSINDVRKMENMNPIEGGDERFVPMNMVPLSLATGGNQALPQSKLEENGEETKNIRYWGRQLLENGRARISNRAAGTRQRIAFSYQRLLKAAAKQIVNIETKAIGRAITKHLTKRAVADFNKWLDEFYGDLPDKIHKRFMPVLISFAEQIQAEAAKEIGADVGMTPELERFIDEYLGAYSSRYVNSSIGQLRDLMKRIGPDDLGVAVQKRTDEWDEKRSEKEAMSEATRFSNAVSVAVFLAAGIQYLRWATVGESCPYCSALNGKVVGKNSWFFQEGDDHQPDGQQPMKITGNVRHPPLHLGCDCQIVAK